MSRGNDRLDEARRRTGRQRIAFEAARLMATQGLGDTREAARRAAHHLGEGDERALPTHAEVIEQLRDYQRLFQADTQPRELRRRREAALEAMEFLSDFEPRLVGRVLDGSADDKTPISLQVFAEDPEAFAIFLANQGWPATGFEARVRVRRDRSESFLGWRLLAGGLPFEIVALPPALLRQPPFGPDDRPMERATAAALRALLQREASGL